MDKKGKKGSLESRREARISRVRWSIDIITFVSLREGEDARKGFYAIRKFIKVR